MHLGYGATLIYGAIGIKTAIKTFMGETKSNCIINMHIFNYITFGILFMIRNVL